MPSLLSAAVEIAGIWVGTLNYGKYAVNSPINFTVTGATARADWIYNVDAGGHFCVPDLETGLKVLQNGANVTFQGSGKNPAFYSFAGTIEGDSIRGEIYDHGQGVVGHFSAKHNGPKPSFHCTAPPPPPPPPPPHPTTHALIWPLPLNYTNGSATVRVSPGENFFKGPATSKLLAAAFERYYPLTFPHPTPSTALLAPQRAKAASVAELTVAVESEAEDFPQLETDESYSLSVSDKGTANLRAKTVYGALRGLETFSQLVIFDFDTQSYTIPFAPWNIEDKPRFPHRGLMIDSARHFEPIATIKDVISSLTYAKLNVLHWHMSDTQSFPFEVKSSPKLWNGAWSPQERFTQLDVAEVVEFARLRGVRVIVEFDMPGHAGSWCKGYPEICPASNCTQPLNLANNATFTLIESLLHECTGGVASAPGRPSPGLFKDNFIHLGGDEVDTACWSSTPSVAAWLKARNLTADDGYAYFVKKVAGFAISQGHRPVQWSEVYDHFKNTLPKKVIIHIWKSVTNVTEPLAGGYNAIVNVGYDKLSWYLDNLNVDWQHVYMNEPCAGVPDDLCPMILGGHGEMWGETVDTSDIEQTVWPRLAAISERLWSPRELNDPVDAKDRIQAFRCLLNRRAVAAAPVDNPTARSAPSGPGGCYSQ